MKDAKRRPLGAVENELAEDLLRPGGAGLSVGRDDDIVRPELEIVPTVDFMWWLCISRVFTGHATAAEFAM